MTDQLFDGRLEDGRRVQNPNKRDAFWHCPITKVTLWKDWQKSQSSIFGLEGRGCL
jgi:hypothetical protein